MHLGVFAIPAISANSLLIANTSTIIARHLQS